MSIFANKYRIVTDRYLGYEPQIKRWWCPWKPIGCHTFRTIEEAKKFIINYNKVVWCSDEES